MQIYNMRITGSGFFWEKILDDGELESSRELTKKDGLTRARITQIMNLLKLPSE